MSHTPIYDELRELRITRSSDRGPGARRYSVRLTSSPSGTGTVDHLAGRRGLGGRHRRTAS
ncbi:hypothetical protein [Pseudonocardia spinosispora]|uniref:hypothetical protein n=1 Tax=Pseudonocardia spinosispora TaxID=103441 RepID=UPI000402D87B|nr:hypothetical protein [Pseudonocardia spinosispora]